MEITKGKWEVSKGAYSTIVNVGAGAQVCTLTTGISLANVNNATLIADAGNTYQQTKKLPSELAEANKELLEALQLLLKSHRQLSFNENHNLNDTPLEAKIFGLIKKHSNA